MATVERRGKVWCVRYWVKDDLGNRTGQKRVSGFHTKEDAMAAAKDLERKTAAGIDVHGGNTTCGEIMEKWFETKVGVVSETTLANYSSQIDKLRGHAIYTTQVKQLTRGSLKVVMDGLIKDRGISVQTARDYTTPLRFGLRWASDEGIIPINPIQGARMPKAEKPVQHIMSEEDIHDLIDKCQGTPFLTPVYLALYGGLCREECVGLTWDHVDLVHGTVTIEQVITLTQTGKRVKKEPKTGNRRRSVTLPSFVVEHLRVQPHVSEHVCVSSNQKAYSPWTYGATMRKLVRSVNRDRDAQEKKHMPPVTFHDLRHTHAALLIKLGVHMKVISERLGHASIKITMDTYGYLMPGMQEQAAQALDQWVGTKSGTSISVVS